MPRDADDYRLKSFVKPRSAAGKVLLTNKKTGLQLLNKPDLSRRFKKKVMMGKKEVQRGRLLR